MKEESITINIDICYYNKLSEVNHVKEELLLYIIEKLESVNKRAAKTLSKLLSEYFKNKGEK